MEDLGTVRDSHWSLEQRSETKHIVASGANMSMDQRKSRHREQGRLHDLGTLVSPYRNFLVCLQVADLCRVLGPRQCLGEGTL